MFIRYYMCNYFMDIDVDDKTLRKPIKPIYIITSANRNWEHPTKSNILKDKKLF